MPDFPTDARLKGAEVSAAIHAADAHEFYAPLFPLLLDLHSRRLSYREIARELESRGIKSRLGFPSWSPTSVGRALARALASTRPRAAETVDPDVGDGQQTAQADVAAVQESACCEAPAAHHSSGLPIAGGERLVVPGPGEPMPPPAFNRAYRPFGGQ